MRALPKVLSLLIAMVCGYASLTWAAQPKAETLAPAGPEEEKNSLAERLMGSWVLAEATTPGNPSGIGTRSKTFTPGKWEMVQRDPNTGDIIFRHGGTYRLNGDVLEQKVEFASNRTKSYIGQVRKFKITVTKDTYTQIGLDNPFNEVWKRDGV